MPSTDALIHLERELAKEREARLEAERLAEEKTRELQLLNRQLELEVEQRTRELEEARDKALEASRVKSRFLTKVSQQLKAPLNGVLGLCNAVENSQLPASEPDAFRYVRIAAENLLEIVRDVLDYTDIQEGQVSLASQPLCLRELTQTALHNVANLSGDKDLWLECSVSPDVHDKIMGDRQALRRVLMNLIHNAIKFTENGTVEITVHCVGEGEEGQRLRFAVADTGMGIPEEARRHLFDPFSGKKKTGGSGLGLAVASRLVALMGGELQVESEQGRGSRFFFELEMGLAPDMPDEEPLHSPTRCLDILVVDDEEITQQIVLRMLEHSGHKICLAADGRDALSLLKSQRFDLVLMDLQMPNLNGYEATVALRKYEKANELSATPVVAMTASVSALEREKCLQSGLDGHLVKPLRRDELLRTVARVEPREERRRNDWEHLPEVFSRIEEPGRVLIVDDEPTNRKLVRNVLANAKHTVFEATNGEQALRVLEVEPVDVILMDAVMPRMDGFETCARIKSDPAMRKIPVLFVTALDDRSERIRATDVGADDFLSKPVDTRQLKLRVRNAVQSKRLFDEVQRSYHQLQALEQLRDELAQMVVHDMRNPLTGILGYAQLLGFAEGLNETEKGYLRTITGLGSMLREMVSSILDVSRLESDELMLAPSRTDLVKLVRGEVNVIRFLQSKPPLVYSPDQLEVNCDEELIRRVLANFLSNAQKYNPEDRSLEVYAFLERGFVRVEVRDFGPGVPEHLRTKIFEKFAQVEDAEERKTYSSGLGLTFCKLAVEKHGGKLGVKSPEGPGSIFWFELPAPTD